MDEESSGGNPGNRLRYWSNGAIDGLKQCGRILREGLSTDVRSALRFSIRFESSIGLLLFYAACGMVVTKVVVGGGI